MKENASIDLICIGCFSGNETLIRVTKGKNHTITVFKEDGSQYSFNWGESGYTRVSELMDKLRETVQKCIEFDFGIYIGSNRQKVLDTCYIKKITDKKKSTHIMNLTSL